VGAGEVVPKVARLPKADSSISGGFVSSYDPRGARLVYIVEELAAGGARVFEALLDEARGLVDFQVYRAARGQVRSFVRDITRRPRFGAVEAEAESIRALIARRVAGQVADQRLPKAFAEWRGKFTRVVEGTETPGGLVREALEQGASAEALRELAEMVERRELGPWPPNREPLEKAIAGLREQLAGEAESGAAAADSELLEERVRSVLTELYTGESADANAERFEESAYLMWRGQQEEMARACLATADALRTGDAADQPVVAALIAVFAPALTKDMRTSLGSGPSRDEVSVAEPEQESEPKQE